MLDQPADIIARQIKVLYKHNNIGDKTSCHSGCSYCCHQIVTISVFEAARIAKSLLKLPPSKLIQIKNQAQINVSINDKIAVDSERWKHRAPCPLLIDNKCSINSKKPIACDMTNSISKGICKSQFYERNDRGHEVQMLTIEGVSMLTVAKGLLDEAIRLGELPDISLINYIFQVDLDRLIAFLTQGSKKEKRRNYKLLMQLNKETIKSLEKRSISQQEFDEISAKVE